MPQSFHSPYLTNGKRTLGAEDKYLVTRKLPAPRHPGGRVTLETVIHWDVGFRVFLERREAKIPGQGMVPCVLQFSLHKRLGNCVWM